MIYNGKLMRNQEYYQLSIGSLILIGGINAYRTSHDTYYNR